MIASVESVTQSPFNGLLLIDKPSGYSSHDVVARARRIMGTKSIGHAGTLDPIASGLLVLLVGEATKLSNYILNGDKGYEVKVRLGVETDTLDRSGHITRETEVHVSEGEILCAAEKLSGKLLLPVPKFSAVKIAGKTLYKEARSGREVEVPSREMNFYEVEVLEVTKPYVRVRMKCSKGSYVRSWAAELGRILKVGACVESLRRVWSDPYEVEGTCTLETLQSRPWHTLQAAIPMVSALPDWPSIVVDGKDQQLIKNGQLSYGLKGRLRVFYRNQQTGQKIPGVKVMSKGQNERQLLALLEPGLVEGDFRIARVINNVT